MLKINFFAKGLVLQPPNSEARDFGVMQFLKDEKYIWNFERARASFIIFFKPHDVEERRQCLQKLLNGKHGSGTPEY